MVSRRVTTLGMRYSCSKNDGIHIATPRTIRIIVLSMLSWAIFFRKYLMVLIKMGKAEAAVA
jgi:hypothetical protein